MPGDSAAQTEALNRIPIPGEMRKLLCTSELSAGEQSPTARLLIEFFIFYLAVREAGLPEDGRILAKIIRDNDGHYLDGLFNRMREKLRLQRGLRAKMIRKMAAKEREVPFTAKAFEKYFKPGRFVYPSFLHE